MAEIKVDDQAITTALAKLSKLQLAASMGEIRQRWTNRVLMGFRTSTDPYGTPWAAITHRSGQPLRHTGRLRNSIPASSRSGEDYVELGTNVEYAPIHQFGKTGTMPVPAHKRRITQAFGKPIAPKTIDVKAHTRKVNIKARPFFPDKGLPEPWRQDALTAITRQLQKTIED